METIGTVASRTLYDYWLNTNQEEEQLSMRKSDAF